MASSSSAVVVTTTESTIEAQGFVAPTPPDSKHSLYRELFRAVFNAWDQRFERADPVCDEKIQMKWTFAEDLASGQLTVKSTLLAADAVEVYVNKMSKPVEEADVLYKREDDEEKPVESIVPPPTQEIPLPETDTECEQQEHETKRAKVEEEQPKVEEEDKEEQEEVSAQASTVEVSA